MTAAPDMVNAPPHYTSHPSGVECIQVTEHLNFCIGNAIKYLWRTDDKGDAIENLRKAIYYIEREIKRRQPDEPTGERCEPSAPITLNLNLDGKLLGQTIATVNSEMLARLTKSLRGQR